jgi:hypothetical protein
MTIDLIFLLGAVESLLGLPVLAAFVARMLTS